MDTAGIRFADIEWSANLTLAHVILATEAGNNWLLLYRMSRVLSELEKLLRFLGPDDLQSRTDDQRHRLALSMRDAHKRLAQFSRTHTVEKLRRIPMLNLL